MSFAKPSVRSDHTRPPMRVRPSRTVTAAPLSASVRAADTPDMPGSDWEGTAAKNDTKKHGHGKAMIRRGTQYGARARSARKNEASSTAQSQRVGT